MPFLNRLITISLLCGALNVKAEVASFEGTYDMKLSIGDRAFNDVMELKGEFNRLDMLSADYDVLGQITVPNVFTAPLKGTLSSNVAYKLAYLRFSIVARENGQEFNVFYEADINFSDYDKILRHEMPVTFYGNAYLDNRKLLGPFKAVKRE